MDFPPLTSVEDYPLHPDEIYEAGILWACSTPEREPDGRTAYDWRCRACVIAAQANIENLGDHSMWWTPTGGAEPQLESLSWMVARSLYWLEQPGPTPEG